MRGKRKKVEKDNVKSLVTNRHANYLQLSPLVPRLRAHIYVDLNDFIKSNEVSAYSDTDQNSPTRLSSKLLSLPPPPPSDNGEADRKRSKA